MGYGLLKSLSGENVWGEKFVQLNARTLGGLNSSCNGSLYESEQCSVRVSEYIAD